MVHTAPLAGHGQALRGGGMLLARTPSGAKGPAIMNKIQRRLFRAFLDSGGDITNEVELERSVHYVAAGFTGAQGTRRSGPATSMGPRPHRQWDQGPTVPAASGRWAPQAHCANLPLLFRIRGSPEMRAELYELAS